MSVLSVSQLVQSLQDVLLHVDSKTKVDLPIADRSNTQRTYVDWIAVAEEAAQVAEKSLPDLPQLDQLVLALKYRTQSLEKEAPAEFDPLMELFRNLSIRMFPSGIPSDFTEKQIHYLRTNYPSFASKLIERTHEKLAADFFRFALLAPSQSSHRGKDAFYWVAIFVKYPEIAARLMKSSLYEKLGQYAENVFIHPEKGVCLKMELWDGSAWVPIHFRKEDLETRLCFKNRAPGEKTAGIRLTLEEIFKQFESPLTPNLDVSSTGIVNINSQLLICKESDEKIHRIDPEKWTEYMPSVELELPELMKLFPEAKSEPLFALILRVNLLAPKDGQAFFDFIMKLENGKYRVISLQGHQKPGAALYQQKRLFYSLTSGQGNAVIRMVAGEIARCRTAQAEGKKIPSINIQTYVDEILGQNFYALLETLASDEFKAHLSQVRQSLDTAAFEEFLRPVIDKMMKLRDMAQIHLFITTSLTTIQTILQKDGPTIVLPTEQEVTEACKNHFDQMGPSLVALASLCFEVLHPYRISVAAAEKDTPVIAFIFRKIESIPWKWLKNLLYGFFLTVLGPFRGYRYKTMASPHPRSLSGLVQSIRNLVPERHINRPSQLFDSLSDAQKQSVEARIKTHMTVLTAPVNA
jgi:hypothetical protein